MQDGKSKSYLIQLFITFSSRVLSACADAPGGADGRDRQASDCIYGSTIRGYGVLDEANLMLEASARRKYHVGLQRRALGLRSSRGISFDSPTSRVCSYSFLLFDGQFGNESTPIAFVRELSPDEEERLLIRYGRKEPENEQTPAPVELPGAEVEELDSGSRDDSSGA